MIQRSSTYVLSSKSITDILMKGLYDENGPPTDVADILSNSSPNILNKVSLSALAQGYSSTLA